VCVRVRVCVRVLRWVRMIHVNAWPQVVVERE
jgi:hypothetical protein